VLTGGVLLVLDLTSRPASSDKQASFSVDCLPGACGVRAWGQF
jgi:hypothetical protein